MKRIILPDQREVHFRTAAEGDVEAIIALYHDVYSGRYPLEEFKQPKAIRRMIADPNCFWMVAFCEHWLVGSLVFLIDPVNKVAKAYAAVVRPEYRGLDVMHTLTAHGVERLTAITRTADVVYATTRTVTMAPQVVLEHLNFHPLGIFPNAHRVKAYETHGLEVFFRPGALELRRPNPRLVPEVQAFYEVAADVLSLKDEPEIVELPVADLHRKVKPVRFTVDRDVKAVQRRFDADLDHERIERGCFSFMAANVALVAQDIDAEIYLDHHPEDGHAMVLGIRCPPAELRRALVNFGEVATDLGLRYLELLVNAYRPQTQRDALDAWFLPSAYFAALGLADDGRREDYFVFTRTFENLDFMDMQLVATNRRFLDAFMKCWYEMLVRSQKPFDGSDWRIS